jgi:hypothetical protein
VVDVYKQGLVMKLLKILKNAKAQIVTSAILLSAAPFGAFASRLAEGQVSYLSKIGTLLADLFLILLGAGGAVVFLLACWVFIKDFVLAKADHEKKFSIGQLIAGVVVASMMMYPAGSMMLGSDLSAGSTAGGTKIEAKEFKTVGNGTKK